MQKIKNILHHNKESTTGTAATQNTAHHNPLDRNHDGKVDMKDLTGKSNNLAVPASELEARRNVHTELLGKGNNVLHPMGLNRGLPLQNESLAMREPINMQRVEKETVVHEHIHPVEKAEIQPVIYREREQLDIKQVTQQLHETQIQPTLIQQRELAPLVKEPIVERSAPIQENFVAPSYDVNATQRSTQVNAPIVEETIKKTVIEEIQPVLERDVFKPTLVQQTQPIFEKVVEAPTVYREVLPTRELGTRNVESDFFREAPMMAPEPQMMRPVSMVATTTTTDSFVPAKLAKEGDLKNLSTDRRSPLERRVL